MQKEYVFIVPLCPVSKKNSQQILINRSTHRPFIMPSAKYKKYEKQAMGYLVESWMEDMDEDFPIDYPVNVECHFYMETRRKCDLTNLLESIDDVLVKAGILEDDNYTILESHDGSRIFYDKENPRTEIYIKGKDR